MIGIDIWDNPWSPILVPLKKYRWLWQYITGMVSIGWWLGKTIPGWLSCAFCGACPTTLGYILDSNAVPFPRWIGEHHVGHHALLLATQSTNLYQWPTLWSKGLRIRTLFYDMYMHLVNIYNVLFENNILSNCHVSFVGILGPFPTSIQVTNGPVNRGAMRRTVLMISLITCLGGLWTVEQPGGSILEFYPSWREIMQRIFASGGPSSVASTNDYYRCDVKPGSKTNKNKVSTVDKFIVFARVLTTKLRW